MTLFRSFVSHISAVGFSVWLVGMRQSKANDVLVQAIQKAVDHVSLPPLQAFWSQLRKLV